MSSTVIVGGGLAGAMCGLKLLQAGKDCTIYESHDVEKKSKLCGGLITEKTIRLLKSEGFNPEPFIKSKINKVTMMFKGVNSFTVKTKTKFYLLHRADLDKMVLDAFVNAGGKLIDKTRVTSINGEEKYVTTNDGSFHKYDYLIGADGASGVTTKKLDKKVPLAFGIEAEIPLQDINVKSDEIVLDVGLLKDGYAWVFPKGDYITVGLACTYDKTLDYKGQLQKWLSDTFNYKGELDIRGAFLPYCVTKLNPVKKSYNLMCIGDAGGFINSITGEGTYYAILSAKYAAESIKEGKDIVSSYSKKVKLLIYNARISTTLIHTFYRNRKMLYAIAKKKIAFVRFFCDEMVSYEPEKYSVIQMLSTYKKRNEITE